MVYMTPSDLGWKPYKASWLNRYIKQKDAPKTERVSLLHNEARNCLNDLFDLYVDEAFTKLENYTNEQ